MKSEQLARRVSSTTIDNLKKPLEKQIVVRGRCKFESEAGHFLDVSCTRSCEKRG